ncbi:MAG: glycoside hydrolase family 97 catalytic domain-containing protein [Prevotella sp.]|nr:glycoside hydrolase family 97 catalytic domain-containing protein [Prevotella sp.]
MKKDIQSFFSPPRGSWWGALIILFLFASVVLPTYAADHQVTSPDGHLVLTLHNDAGRAEYDVTYDGHQMLTRSRLGFKSDLGDFSQNLSLQEVENTNLDWNVDISRVKTSHSQGSANGIVATFENADHHLFQVEFFVGNNDVAFRYIIPRPKEDNPKCAVIYEEASSFNFPSQTTTFLCPQINPMAGWERTKPSYEEDYTADAPLTAKSRFGVGYTFPCLFRVGDDGWVLVSETGVSSAYCASHLSDYNSQTGYTIAFPMKGEGNGYGSEYAAVPLRAETPWRTITLGNTLKPIVETTIAYDLVDPLYEPTTEYQPGRYTWSWLIWQDESINYNDQVQFIDLAAQMGFEYCLVDNWWDDRIGRERIEVLSEYAKAKGVHLMLWYNSNGFYNDAPQTPRDCMSSSIARDREMAWLQKIGVKGIKVDFFGSDKQETMRLYEDILFDANRYGLQVIFHGCTIPRGWERMYPNYVASEAALASENVFFSEFHAKNEGFELTMHPFSRNALGTFDWGGIIMNRYMSRDNKSRHRRYTTDTFEMASGIVLQTSVNCVAMQPNNLDELKDFQLDFLRHLPTTWDETRFIDGYPTKYVVLARRHGNQWYVAGLNGTGKAMTLNLNLPMFEGQTVRCYNDRPVAKGSLFAEPEMKTVKVDKQGHIRLTLQPLGGIILTH